jgi:hypothetical protein
VTVKTNAEIRLQNLIKLLDIQQDMNDCLNDEKLNPYQKIAPMRKLVSDLGRLITGRPIEQSS